MRVLVTGGAGFIGSHIVDRMLADGHDVAILDDFSTGRRENVAKNAKLYELDLRDREGVFRIVSDFRPTHVSHHAAQASVAVSVREPILDASVNVIGGLNLLDACTRDARVERFVFASTGGAIYGEVPEGSRANEQKIPTPISPYAIHKFTFELLLGVYRRERGLTATTLRYANVYGPRQDPHGEAGVVAIFLGLLFAGKPLRVNARAKEGDDGCIRDYVYVGDVAEANALALAGRVSEPILNVGTGNATSTLELAKTIMTVAGRDGGIVSGAYRAGDLERSVLDPSRTERYLVRMVSLKDGLAKTYASMAGAEVSASP
jgi:UDP-glucose 4-epimerase